MSHSQKSLSSFLPFSQPASPHPGGKPVSSTPHSQPLLPILEGSLSPLSPHSQPPPNLDLEIWDHLLSHCSLQALVLPGPRPYVRAGGAAAPDHWLDPVTVWEVKCADLSLSPIYPAARTLVSDRPGTG